MCHFDARSAKRLVIRLLPYYDQNPYQVILARSLRARGFKVETAAGKKSLFRLQRPDVLHIHWLHPFVQPWWAALLTIPAMIVQCIAVRVGGGAVAWTLHNEQAHDDRGRRLEYLLARIMGKLASAVIVHNETAAAIAIEKFNVHREKVQRVPHGHYMDWYKNEISKESARDILGLPDRATVLTFLGSIRRYKGVEELVEAFAETPAPNAYLIIAGRFDDPSLERRLMAVAGSDSRIRIYSGYVPDDEVQVYLNATDAVILPYRKVLTSGSVLMAMSFGRACILPDHAGLRDLLPEGGAIFYDSRTRDGLTGAIREAIANPAGLARSGSMNLRTVAAEHDWDRIAELTMKAYGRPESGVDA